MPVRRNLNRIAIPLLALLFALALVACGGNGDDDATGETDGDAATQTEGPEATSQGAATVAVRDSELGPVLVDRQGMTLYLFEKDRAGESACYGACASDWPPLIASGDPAAGEGAEAGELGTVQRRDGSEQVTYAGHPLYYFAGDEAPGDTNGHGLDGYGAEWYALTPAGDRADDDEQEESEEDEAESGDDEDSGPYGY